MYNLKIVRETRPKTCRTLKSYTKACQLVFHNADSTKESMSASLTKQNPA